MESQGPADEDDNVGWSQYDDTYVREDFPSVEDWLYCKKMVVVVILMYGIMEVKTALQLILNKKAVEVIMLLFNYKVVDLQH